MRIYIPTYRRPEFCLRVFRSVRGKWPVTFVAPSDEASLHTPTLQGGADFIWVEEDKGVGHARWLAGEDAYKRGLDWFAFSDDDCIYPKAKDSIGLMGAAVMKYPEVAAVSRRTAWPLPPSRPWYNEEEQLAYYNDKIGVCWVHKSVPYWEVGGIDRTLTRLEDHDLGLRLLLANYLILEHRGATVSHRSFQPGGCAAREGGGATEDGRRKAADNSRRKHAAILITKYPGLLKVREDGFFSRNRPEFERIQQAYVNGECVITESGVKWRW